MLEPTAETTVAVLPDLHGGFIRAASADGRMRRVRLTFYAPDAEVHPVHTTLAERDYVEAAEMVHWNDAGETMTHAFYVEGDAEAFAAELDGTSAVQAYDLTTVGDECFYAHVRAETTPLQRRMFDTYHEGGAVVTSTLEHTDDGGVTFEVVGTAEALQAFHDGAPDEIDVVIDSVGGPTADPETTLSKRQREAVEAALTAGYYDVPRTATHEDVARRLDCAPSTASEHLRKAESKVLHGLFGE
ncbi:helix-turn-helix domain-containing protein [Halorussus gelatinilyticus]|uniref:Helix-turn-helix domain-containing protein n=1 Tax=Halorussus gelatinilyticus TaxID=2937524 RepID=A0A8U0II18_9EURY|nr:helix-turn-helix domain-containing protein [Halorussus gelatinilyticus]UPW00311.1 helix-turn-helix domain-containing protein [Halorussus gelatinilyticus]